MSMLRWACAGALIAASGCSLISFQNHDGSRPVRSDPSAWRDVALSLTTSADERLRQFDREFPSPVDDPPPQEGEQGSADDDRAGTGESADVVLASHASQQEQDEKDAPHAISMMDAIHAAAQDNPRLRVLSYLPLEAATETAVQQARFDTSLTAGTQLLNANQQAASAVQANAAGRPLFSSTSVGPANNTPNLVQVQKQFTSGTIARLGATTNYNESSPAGQFLLFNPAYQSGVTAVIEQPLLRGFGSEVNLAGSRIALMGTRQSQAEFRAELHRTLHETQRAYWAAWLAQTVVQTYGQIVAEAQLTLDIARQRLQLGEGGLVETAQAQENLAALKVEREQARQGHLTAINRLKAMMGLPADDTRPLELIERPIEEAHIPDLQTGLESASSSRPELRALQLSLQQAQLQLQLAENSARPDLVAYAGYGLTGLDTGFLGSLNEVTSTDYGNLTMGVRFQHVFGRRAEKAAAERARLALQRQRMTVREAEQEIAQRVREIHDVIQTSWRVLLRQQERAEASEIQYTTYGRLYQAGQLDLDRLIRARTLLATALQERETALIDYNLALAQWNFAVGIINQPEHSPSQPVPSESLTRSEGPNSL